MKRGRKPIYNPETLKIGDKIELPASIREFGHQYATNFSKKLKSPGAFKCIKDKKKVFIERVL